MRLRSGLLPSLLFHEVEGLLQLVQHRKRKKIYLGEAGVGHAVLVPVQDEAALRGPGPHGDHFRHGGAAEDHAAHVLAQPPGGVHQLGGEFQQVSPAGGVYSVPEVRQLEQLLAEVPGVVGVESLGRGGRDASLGSPRALPRSWMMLLTL